MLFDYFGVRFILPFSKNSRTLKMAKKAGKWDKHGHNFVLFSQATRQTWYHTSAYHLSALYCICWQFNYDAPFTKNTTLSTVVHRISDIKKEEKNVRTTFDISDTRLLDAMCHINLRKNDQSNIFIRCVSGEKNPFAPGYHN